MATLVLSACGLPQLGVPVPPAPLIDSSNFQTFYKFSVSSSYTIPGPTNLQIYYWHDAKDESSVEGSQERYEEVKRQLENRDAAANELFANPGAYSMKRLEVHLPISSSNRFYELSINNGDPGLVSITVIDSSDDLVGPVIEIPWSDAQALGFFAFVEVVDIDTDGARSRVAGHNPADITTKGSAGDPQE